MIPDFFANLHDFEQKGGIKYNIKYTSKTDDGDPIPFMVEVTEMKYRSK